jgi:hypothetical protein
LFNFFLFSSTQFNVGWLSCWVKWRISSISDMLQICVCPYWLYLRQSQKKGRNETHLHLRHSWSQYWLF